MKYIFIIVLIAFSASCNADNLKIFSTETAAISYCSNDNVVWLNLLTGIFHEKKTRWFSKTKNGGFTCKQEAIAYHYRASLSP